MNQQTADAREVPVHPRGGYFVFDVETTGLGDRCQIVEFAGVLLNAEGDLVGSYETLVKPGSGPGPTRVHGISAAMLNGAPTFAEVAGDIERLFRDRVPVAHNLRFDWGVLRRSYASLGVDLPAAPGGICTARWSRRLFPGPCALVAVCCRLGVDYAHPHRAGSDAVAAAAVFREIRRIEPQLAVGRPCPPFAGAWHLPRSVPGVSRRMVGDCGESGRRIMAVAGGRDGD